MAANMEIEIANEKDLPELAAIINPAFQNVPAEVLMFGTTSPETLKLVATQHLEAWRIHAKESSLPCAIKCVHTDPDSGTKTIVGCAEWYMFDRERLPENYSEPSYLLNASWMTDKEARAIVLDFLKPVVDKHKHWMGGRPHAVLRYMAVAPEWRRRGAASMCVQWGLERCKELGISAYLEASEEGAPVYERLGFEKCDVVETFWDGERYAWPAMIWWPEGMERSPVLH